MILSALLKRSGRIFDSLLTELHGSKFHVSLDDIKGRILITNEEFNAGQIILQEEPLLVAKIATVNPIYQRLVKWNGHSDFSLEPLWYWCALCSLFTHEDAQILKNNQAPELEKFCSEILALPLHRISRKTQESLLLFYSTVDGTFPESATAKKIRKVIIKCFGEIEAYFMAAEKKSLDIDDDIAADYAISVSTISNEEEEQARRNTTTPATNRSKVVKVLKKIIDGHLFDRLVDIWVLNCFEYDSEPLSYACFFCPTLASHSCEPAAIWSLDEFPGGVTKFKLVARRKIEKNEEITISYLADAVLCNYALQRQAVLNTTKHFTCQCERCTYPVDLARGFRCPSCKIGTVFLAPGTTMSKQQQRSFSKLPEAVSTRFDGQAVNNISSIGGKLQDDVKEEANSLGFIIPVVNSCLEIEMGGSKFMKAITATPLRTEWSTVLLNQDHGLHINKNSLPEPKVCLYCGYKPDAAQVDEFVAIESVCQRAISTLELELENLDTDNTEKFLPPPKVEPRRHAPSSSPNTEEATTTMDPTTEEALKNMEANMPEKKISPEAQIKAEAAQVLTSIIPNLTQHACWISASDFFEELCEAMNDEASAIVFAKIKRDIFQRVAPCASASYAWACESVALHSLRLLNASHGCKIRSVACLQQILDSPNIFPQFFEALAILRLIFHASHEYYVDVEKKLDDVIYRMKECCIENQSQLMMQEIEKKERQRKYLMLA